MKPDILIWAKDENGHRHLCSMDKLDDPNFVRKTELDGCIDDDSHLTSRSRVPSNDPEGKIRFARSVSLN
ncbi:MAG: hypothetical protein ABFD97_06510 [Syntrophobacter sp.]